MQNQNENFTFEGFKKENNKFIPTTSLHNHHRHFGTCTNQKIYFDLEELLYLNNMPELKDYKLYSLFKNNNYNLRKKNDFLKEYFIFNKHKHFNRKKDLPIGICKNVGKENCFIKEIEDCDGLFCVLRIESEDSCCLKVEFVGELDKNLEIKDYKN